MAFVVGPAGIPTSKPSQIIVNTDESKFEQGYDSDSDIGPFMNAVTDDQGIGAEDDDEQEGVLPASMVGVSESSVNRFYRQKCNCP